MSLLNKTTQQLAALSITASAFLMPHAAQALPKPPYQLKVQVQSQRAVQDPAFGLFVSYGEYQAYSASSPCRWYWEESKKVEKLEKQKSAELQQLFKSCMTRHYGADQ